MKRKAHDKKLRQMTTAKKHCTNLESRIEIVDSGSYKDIERQNNMKVDKSQNVMEEKVFHDATPEKAKSQIEITYKKDLIMLGFVILFNIVSLTVKRANGDKYCGVTSDQDTRRWRPTEH